MDLFFGSSVNRNNKQKEGKKKGKKETKLLYDDKYQTLHYDVANKEEKLVPLFLFELVLVTSNIV